MIKLGAGHHQKIILYGSIVGFVLGGLFIVRTSQAGVNAIIEHEGYRSQAYKDFAGHWTIGYGHLIRDNEQHLMSVTLTKEQAMEILRKDLEAAEIAVSRLVTVPLNQNQHDALVSFVFNFGEPKFSTSTLLRKINIGDFDGAADEFRRWNNARNPATGQLEPSPILTARREREREMFLA